MRLGIDASNLRYGGGVTHLIEFLRAANPPAHGISEIVVWGGTALLGKIEERPWLTKRHQLLLDRGLIHRLFWQRFILQRAARASYCDMLWVPGGTYSGDFRPFVAMCRNMLPFQWPEVRRFGWSWTTLRLLLLRWSQASAFKRADGLIFLSKFAQREVLRIIGGSAAKQATIPHGVSARFLQAPRAQLSESQFSEKRPFRILYVSIINLYKHQSKVAEAVSRLRETGLEVVLELVGPAHPQALKLLNATRFKLDPEGKFILYSGQLPHAELHERYAKADLCLFASSCENMPNILLEGMASGLPVACSNRGPMPEILGEAGVYFDPEKTDEITSALRTLIKSSELRTKSAEDAFRRAREFSWQRCAQDTLDFLSTVST